MFFSPFLALAICAGRGLRSLVVSPLGDASEGRGGSVSRGSVVQITPPPPAAMARLCAECAPIRSIIHPGREPVDQGPSGDPDSSVGCSMWLQARGACSRIPRHAGQGMVGPEFYSPSHARERSMRGPFELIRRDNNEVSDLGLWWGCAKELGHGLSHDAACRGGSRRSILFGGVRGVYSPGEGV